jgi:hypothetical protein
MYKEKKWRVILLLCDEQSEALKKLFQLTEIIIEAFLSVQRLKLTFYTQRVRGEWVEKMMIFDSLSIDSHQNCQNLMFQDWQIVEFNFSTVD